ncbi:MAG: protealysin inhibitor emfourin [Labedaea sp.]
MTAKPERAKPALRVRVARTGGFAGIARTTEADAATLPAESSARLRELVADLEELEPLPASRQVPDGFRYRIDIWHDGAHRHLELKDPFVPPSARELVALVERLEAQR